jgi:Zn-dependent M28 family amino/carboxypeptidase
MDTALPIGWPVFAGPGLVALGAARRRRGTIAAGTAVAAGAAASFADIARSATVPGANDNLTAVAALVALAERLRDHPVAGVRVLLVSCGAEETLQEGIRAFAARRFGTLGRERTCFLNLDTVGSPRLILLEGEGPLVMEDYHHKEFRDLVARCAELAGVRLRRGMRARSSTDSIIPSRAGYPTATLASMDRHKALSNYHLMTDTPERVDYETVARAIAVADTVIREVGEPTLAR